ncbi:MAG: glutamine synthetase [bacterium]|nr:glutamine synthetase [bacterium]
MLSRAELQELVLEGEIDTIDVAFTDLYGRLVGKRYDAGFFLEDALENGVHACDYLLTVDIGMEPVAGYAFANWEKGYGDVHLVPDLTTLRRLSFRERTALVLCDVTDASTHAPVGQAPRSVLRRQVASAAAAGFQALGASELEFYSYADTYGEATERGWAGLTPTSAVIEDYHLLQTAREEPLLGGVRRHLAASGVPVENSKGEWGRGQHEVNVRYTDLFEMADRHVVLKQCIKEVAHASGVSVTFMAKPHTGQAGSSCHIHVSLWRDGANAFAGDERFEGIDCTDTFRWFLGGWIARAPELMVLYAPTVNAYKRYQSESWAPTGGAWSYDNRATGFRVVGSGSSLRIECRLPGADCNPYLAFAAALASGLDGIANRTEPPPILRGDGYRAPDGQAPLPRRLSDAAATFASSRFARQAFGDEMVDHYAHFFLSEQAAHDGAVTDWERARYFEQI